MELYIEKVFLDKFYSDFKEHTACISQNAVASILKEYPEITWYIDCRIDTMEEFEKLKIENPFFAYRAVEFPPIAVDSIKTHLFRNDTSWEQTIIFTEKEEDWFKEAELKGALCFSIDNYVSKISSIIKNCHIKIDLSEQFDGWEINLKQIQSLLPLNKIIINDSYLLDKHELYHRNVYPLIKSISKNKKTVKHFFTDILNKNPPFKTDVICELLQEKYPSSEIKIVHNKVDGLKSHDRLLYSNFYIIDCAIGFNFNPNITSNSQIIVETIFEKYTYKRHKRHLKMYQDHLKNCVSN